MKLDWFSADSLSNLRSPMPGALLQPTSGALTAPLSAAGGTIWRQVRLMVPGTSKTISAAYRADPSTRIPVTRFSNLKSSTSQSTLTVRFMALTSLLHYAPAKQQSSEPMPDSQSWSAWASKAREQSHDLTSSSVSECDSVPTDIASATGGTGATMTNGSS